jgi:hypothetical protein
MKVKDGDTGTVSWRSGRKGFRRDWDGDPITTNYNIKDMKPHKTPYSTLWEKAKKR